MSEEKEAKEAKNQNEDEQKAESNDSADLNSLTYEELLEQVEKQKEETLRAVAELENFRKRIVRTQNSIAVFVYSWESNWH